jgi:hypothetical protein
MSLPTSGKRSLFAFGLSAKLELLFAPPPHPHPSTFVEFCKWLPVTNKMTNGTFWQLLTTFLTTFWQLLAIFDNFLTTFLTTFGNFLQLFNNFATTF